jgi:hypothetical protein
MMLGSRATCTFVGALCVTGCAGATASGDAPSRQDSDGSATRSPSEAPESATLTAAAPGPTSAALVLQDQDWSKTWRQLAAPSISKDGALVVGAPGGWLALSTRDQDGSKAPPPSDSFAYFSKDGTHWHAILTPGTDPLQGASVAYGGGHYVIGGTRAETVVLDSTDGETWQEQSLGGRSFAFYNGPITYVKDRFLYVSGTFWGSMDGEHWAALPHDYPFALLEHIAYGNGVYLGVGTQTQLSSDGVEWRAAPLDCALPIDCYPDPDGTLYPSPLGGVFFAEGRFHAWQVTSPDGGLSSPDGVSWQFLPGPFPDAYVAGHFSQFLGVQPTVWLPGDNMPRPIQVNSVPGPPPPAFPEQLPADIDLSWSDGIDCTNARCVIIHSKLYLVP